MVKALDAPYEAGSRGASWLKVKRAHNDLPPRQNSCRPDRTTTPGAAMKDESGSIWTSI